jgi:ATP-dependent helicase/nuclease subunit A
MPKPDKIIPINKDNDLIWLWSQRGSVSNEYTNAVRNHSQTQLAEYYRLLYVAMTRARDELHMFGYTTDKNPPENAWHTHLWRVLAGDTNSEYIRITNDDIA